MYCFILSLLLSLHMCSLTYLNELLNRILPNNLFICSITGRILLDLLVLLSLLLLEK